MPRLRFSTSTLAGEEVVPWLAAAGGLAYSPHSPPGRDYYFQYSWVIPGIFHGGTKVRRHFWFGCPSRDSREVKVLFSFWNRARQGETDTLYVSNGRLGPDNVTAPLAVYRHSDVYTFERTPHFYTARQLPDRGCGITAPHQPRRSRSL